MSMINILGFIIGLFLGILFAVGINSIINPEEMSLNKTTDAINMSTEFLEEYEPESFLTKVYRGLNNLISKTKIIFGGE